MEMEHLNTLPLTDAVNTMSDEPGELTEVLNCATNLQYMQHGDFRKDLNHMVGHMGTGGASDGSGLSGRDKAKLSSFSPLAVSLKQTYNSIPGNEDLADAEVMHILYTVMNSELWPQSVPSHWQIDTGVEFNGALDTDNAALDSDSDRAFQHRLKALIGQAKEVANVRWQECLSGLPLNCEFVLYIQSKRKGTCGQEFEDALERHVHLKGHIVHPKAKCRLPGCNDLAFDTKMAAADHAWDLHAAPLGTSSNCFMIWCRYCELYVWEPIHTSGRAATSKITSTRRLIWCTFTAIGASPWPMVCEMARVDPGSTYRVSVYGAFTMRAGMQSSALHFPPSTSRLGIYAYPPQDSLRSHC